MAIPVCRATHRRGGRGRAARSRVWVPGLVGGGAFVILRRTLRREAGAIEVCAPQTEMEIIGVGRAVIRPDA